MAHVREPYGLTGRVKLHAYSDDRSALADFSTWWMTPPGPRPEWRQVAPEECGERGEALVAKLPGVEDRDAAFAHKGWQIAVPRSEFPASGDNEFYWTDLIGLAVLDRNGLELGKVADLLDLGPHQVLRVRQGEKECLIPFVAQYVDGVDLKSRVVRVDWGPDY